MQMAGLLDVLLENIPGWIFGAWQSKPAGRMLPTGFVPGEKLRGKLHP